MIIIYTKYFSTLGPELLRALPEFEVDYTPLFVLPYDKLPQDLKLWEEKESWLLEPPIKESIKKSGGTLVAKSLDKSSKKATIWRVSLNFKKVFNKV